MINSKTTRTIIRDSDRDNEQFIIITETPRTYFCVSFDAPHEDVIIDKWLVQLEIHYRSESGVLAAAAQSQSGDAGAGKAKEAAADAKAAAQKPAAAKH